MTEPTTFEKQSWWMRYPTGRAQVFTVVAWSLVAVGCSVALGLRVSSEGSVAHEVLGAGRMGGIIGGAQYAFGPKRLAMVPVAILALIALITLERLLWNFS
jgi:hypothetical protein